MRFALRTITTAAGLAAQALWRPPLAKGERQSSFLREFYQATYPVLAWHAAVSSLIIVVIVRLVMVTAESYDLTHYSLQLLIRALILEVIPMLSAIMVALRFSLPRSQHVQAERDLPNIILAGAAGVLFFTLLSCFLALVISYLMLYGLTPWGLASYTHQVGGIFVPQMTLIFLAKTFLFCIVVAVVPLASYQLLAAKGMPEEEISLRSLTRVFLALFVVEVMALSALYW